uniref:Uncharacterized protein n=1 Tax=Salix viminalis TaxID=40686 RepID=A0A6N2M227_SALVM
MVFDSQVLPALNLAFFPMFPNLLPTLNINALVKSPRSKPHASAIAPPTIRSFGMLLPKDFSGVVAASVSDKSSTSPKDLSNSGFILELIRAIKAGRESVLPDALTSSSGEKTIAQCSGNLNMKSCFKLKYKGTIQLNDRRKETTACLLECTSLNSIGQRVLKKGNCQHKPLEGDEHIEPREAMN